MQIDHVTDTELNSYSWSISESCRITDTEHVLSCAMSLAQKDQYGTDTLILCLIRMHVKAEEYHKVLASPESVQAFQLHQFNSYLSNAEAALLDIKMSLSPVLRNSSQSYEELTK
jgi:hypothetical protein